MSIKLPVTYQDALERLQKKPAGQIYSNTDKQAMDLLVEWIREASKDVFEAVNVLETNDPGQPITAKLKKLVVERRRFRARA